jgi:hypothetical protein
VTKDDPDETPLSPREREMQRELLELRARVSALENASGLFVTDAELDHPKAARFTVKFDPRDYRGPRIKGKLARECPPDALDAYASALAWMSENPKAGADPKYAKWNKLDAARARTWARRLRSGWRPEAVPDSEFPEVDDWTTPTESFDSEFEAPSFEEKDDFGTESDPQW